MWERIHHDSKVTILVPNGKKLYEGRIVQEWKRVTGRAVMKGPAGWVLNIGGPHGTPKLATEDNTLFVDGKKN